MNDRLVNQNRYAPRVKPLPVCQRRGSFPPLPIVSVIELNQAQGGSVLLGWNRAALSFLSVNPRNSRKARLGNDRADPVYDRQDFRRGDPGMKMTRADSTGTRPTSKQNPLSGFLKKVKNT